MSERGDTHPGPPVACTLSAAELDAGRQGLLPGLLAAAKAREPIAGGFRWRFAPDDSFLARAAGVIDRERRCCAFLRFRLDVEPGGGPVWLEVTGPPGTEAFLATLADRQDAE